MASNQQYSLDVEQLRQFASLELLARQVVEGFIVGLHRSPFHGFSVEFAEHRLYRPGESSRHIDWKLFGRTEKLFVKKYEEETNLRCNIVLDTSSSMLYSGSNTLSKLQFSIYAAASLIQIMKSQRDAVGLTTFSETIDYQLPAKSNNLHIKQLFTELERLLNTDGKQKRSNPVETLHILAEKLHKRSLVIIFSDMFDNNNSLNDIFGALQHLKYNKHEVVFFHTLDHKGELDFEFENRPYIFEDLETGEKIKLNPNEVKETFKTRSKEFKDAIKTTCNQYKIDYIEADINKGFQQILLPYLTKRIRMRA